MKYIIAFIFFQTLISCSLSNNCYYECLLNDNLQILEKKEKLDIKLKVNDNDEFIKVIQKNGFILQENNIFTWMAEYLKIGGQLYAKDYLKNEEFIDIHIIIKSNGTVFILRIV